jgi:phage gpG-like protein
MAGEKVQLIWYGEEQKKRILTASEKGVRKCGFAIERDAKMMCRVDTGRLRGSISTNWTDSKMLYGEVESPALAADGIFQPQGRDDNEFTVKVGTRVEYAGFIEHGTIKMDKRAFLFPAYELNIGHLPQFIKGELPRSTISLSGAKKASM